MTAYEDKVEKAVLLHPPDIEFSSINRLNMSVIFQGTAEYVDTSVRFYGKWDQESNKLKVLRVYKELPTISSLDSTDVNDGLFSIDAIDSTCRTIFSSPKPCGRLSATHLASGRKQVVQVTHSFTTTPGIDRVWLDYALLRNDSAKKSIVTATLANNTNTMSIVSVFIQLPDPPLKCPLYKLTACPSDKIQAYRRDANRCLVPIGCVFTKKCTNPPIPPKCLAQHHLSTYIDLNGCPYSYCDANIVDYTH
eukprot:gene17690-21095_t